jgi:hypothetical protein
MASSSFRLSSNVAAMGDRQDDRPGSLALDIMARATVAQMQDDADELAYLCQGLATSPDALPTFSREPRERERSRRLLALLAE